MTFGQLMDTNIRNIFPEKSCTKCGENVQYVKKVHSNILVTQADMILQNREEFK